MRVAGELAHSGVSAVGILRDSTGANNFSRKLSRFTWASWSSQQGTRFWRRNVGLFPRLASRDARQSSYRGIQQMRGCSRVFSKAACRERTGSPRSAWVRWGVGDVDVATTTNRGLSVDCLRHLGRVREGMFSSPWRCNVACRHVSGDANSETWGGFLGVLIASWTQAAASTRSGSHSRLP